MQRTVGDNDLGSLRKKYREKIFEDLPEAAERWDDPAVTDDHCFARIVLDKVFNGKWNTFCERPAVKNMSEEELGQAVDVAERILDEGVETLDKLNRESLQYR